MESFMQTLSFFTLLVIVGAEVTLSPVSVTYIPHKYKEEPQFKMFTGAVEQIGFDPKTKLSYTIGGSGYLHVVDMSDPARPSIVYKTKITGVPNDLDVCGDHVAVSVRDEFEPLPGKAVIFKTYDANTRRMRKVNEIQVGNSPASAIVFTRDCRTLLVANEGEAGMDENGNFMDPEGSVTIIRFGGSDLSTNYSVHTASFDKFNKRAEEYVKRGVRWVYHGERSGSQTVFSQDIEPEWIALSEDESLAYVGLQENNAMAVIDVATAEVLEMYPLGVKDWSVSGLDASDKDGGINVRPWRVLGFYQPDSIRRIRHDGVDYLVTANEGDAKRYKNETHGINWCEYARGRVFVEAGLVGEEVDQSLLESLQDENELGRLKMSLVDGRQDVYSQYHTFYAYGGRGFSIWRADNMSLVYDSADDFEKVHEKYLPSVFNSHVDSLQHRPEDDKDVRSDDMGPEVEIVETAVIGGVTYIFVGNQRVSTLMVYSLAPGSIVPRFESVLRPGGLNRTWGDLYESRDVGDGNVQDMRYISPEESPTGQPLLLVSGSISGTLSVYQVNVAAQIPTLKGNGLDLTENGTIDTLEVGRRHKETDATVPPPTLGIQATTWLF